MTNINDNIVSKDHNIAPKFLEDSFGRKISYIRFSITDRCNLRCTYCMPAEGVKFKEHSEILTYEEILKLGAIFYNLEINKFRFTGGEPFVRRGFSDFLRMFKNEVPDASLHLTTNGVLLHKYFTDIIDVGIESINLSLDTLKKDRFQKLTLRDNFEDVLNSLNMLLESNIRLKINMVVQSGMNTDEIIDIASLAEKHNVEVRFIEQMKFNGSDKSYEVWDGEKILNLLKEKYPNLLAIPKKNSTAINYKFENSRGSLGIINGHSRTFCETCNRVRVTSDGKLKTCLYDNGVLDLKKMLRDGNNSEDIIKKINAAVIARFFDGVETEKYYGKYNESMSAIGG